MNVLNILCGGGVGGVENLCKNYGIYSANENKFICIWKPGAISEEMNKLGIPVEVYDTGLTRYFTDFQRLKKDIKKNSYDVLIVHQMAPLISVYLFLLHIIFPELKILTYVHSNAHDWSTKGIRRKVDMALKKFSYRKSVKTVCISESVKRSVIEVLGVEEDKLIVIYNGVDCSQFRPRDEIRHDKLLSEDSLLQVTSEQNIPQHAEAQKGLKLIYVGRLEQVKGVQNILKTIAKLNVSETDEKKGVSVHLAIVGDGSYRCELEKLSRRLGINDKIDFLGTRRDIPSLLCQSDIFIHIPDCQEGFGITVIEAMAAGCICIVNNHGALPEIVEDKVNGYVLPGTDVYKVAELIVNLWKRKEELTTSGSELYVMRENARKRAEEFSIENFARKLDTAVREL